MSYILIQQYLNNLRDLRKVSGTSRESVVREAFKDLLKGWARSHNLIFVPEYEITTPASRLTRWTKEGYPEGTFGGQEPLRWGVGPAESFLNPLPRLFD